MNKAAIIGAGKTGRGFLARLLREDPVGYDEIVFIDKNADLVNRLNDAGSYRIGFFGDVRQPLEIGGYRAYTWDDAALDGVLAECGTILVSVGGQNLPDVGAALKTHLRHVPEAVITAENASHPAETLRRIIGGAVRVSEGTVFCTTIEADGLNIASENYPYFQFDGDALPGYVPATERLRRVAGFADFLTRKLYTYNAASCIIAYLGWIKGYTCYGDAANDPAIVERLDRNYAATNRVLCKVYGYDAEDQREFALLSRTKFMNRTIVDTIARNARDPQRKLAAGERIIGPLRLLRENGEDASVLEETAAAALLYDDPAQTAWRELRAEKGVEGVLRDVCGLVPGEDAYAAIVKQYERLSAQLRK